MNTKDRKNRDQTVQNNSYKTTGIFLFNFREKRHKFSLIYRSLCKKDSPLLLLPKTTTKPDLNPYHTFFPSLIYIYK